MRWAVFGTYDQRRHPRVAVLIEGLRASGDEVVELNEPLPLDTAGRVALLRQPWRAPRAAFDLLRCWLRLRRRSRALPPVDAVLVGYLGLFDIRLARRLFRGRPIVLDHLVSAAGTARDRGLAGAGGLKARLLRWVDDSALVRADLILVDTDEHLAALPAPVAKRAVVVPVGAGSAWFEPAKPREGPLRAIFVGLFTPLHGTGTLAEALAALAAPTGDEVDVEVTMVGTGQEYASARAVAGVNPRVRWIDWVPGDELPALVAAHHVCLGIFGTTVKAANVVPTKVYQGAAAGCAIVTSDTPPQRATLGDAALFVPPGDPGALAAALRSLAADPERTAHLGAAARALAEAHFTPAAVVRPLRAHVPSTQQPPRS
jgi:glycosyltransferase involved in cell wall biosynthesis